MTYAGIFIFGILLGTIVTLLVVQVLKKYDGIIKIILDEEQEKTIYSLELFDDPESLMTEKKVLFRVDTSVE